MLHHLRPVLIALAVAVLFGESALAERVRDASEATVYIRVIGTAKVVVRAAFSETREERDIQLGTGSGFIFTPYGHVLTNHHVIESSVIEERLGSRDVEITLSVDRIEAILPGGASSRFDASIEAVDPELDLAVLSIAGGELPYLALGDSEAATQGDPVHVYGFPFGSQVEVGQTNVPDIVPSVSASRGALAAARTDETGSTAYLQTTATVNPGNSGGPMLDEDGYVLGVIRLKLRDAEGVGFAIPVNTVKEFLTFNGYDQLLPVTPLHLGAEQSLERKGISLRLPDTLEDVSPTRLRAFSDPLQNQVRFIADRVVTQWTLQRLQQSLVSGGTFGTFQAGGELRSKVLADGVGVIGKASDGDEAMEYLLLDLGSEKLVVRYQGPADAVAFNRSVLVGSLESVRAEKLLTNELAGVVSPDAFDWIEAALPAPSAPALVVPDRWEDEVSAPFPCTGLPPWESALSVSPPGDFTVSFRAGWWPETMDTETSARTCSPRAGAQGDGSYAYTVDWLGESYVVEGIFVEDAGTLQLELVTLATKHGFIRDAARAWMEQNGER